MKNILVVDLKIKMLGHQLTEELQKPITRKVKKKKVHSAFIDNIWGPDLADMQLII